ncbi:unnamed protein product, partial [Allacma fusca]
LFRQRPPIPLTSRSSYYVKSYVTSEKVAEKLDKRSAEISRIEIESTGKGSARNPQESGNEEIRAKLPKYAKECQVPPATTFELLTATDEITQTSFAGNVQLEGTAYSSVSTELSEIFPNPGDRQPADVEEGYVFLLNLHYI